MAESSSSALAHHVHLSARPGLPALISEPWHNSGMTGPGDASNEALGLHWPNRLFGYQRDGIERLLNSRSVLLADEMGLGKTIQAIAALRILAARGEIERALIVCPVGLIAQWRRQIRIWAPDLAVSTAVGSRDLRMAAWRAKATLTLSNFESSGRCAFQLGRVAVDDAADEEPEIRRRLRDQIARRAGARRTARRLILIPPGEFDPKAMGSAFAA